MNVERYNNNNNNKINKITHVHCRSIFVFATLIITVFGNSPLVFFYMEKGINPENHCEQKGAKLRFVANFLNITLITKKFSEKTLENLFWRDKHLTVCYGISPR